MWLKIHIFHRRAECWQVKWPMYKQFSAQGKLSFNSEQAGQEEAGVQHRMSVLQFRKSKAPPSHTRENLPLAWKQSCHEGVVLLLSFCPFPLFGVHYSMRSPLELYFTAWFHSSYQMAFKISITNGSSCLSSRNQKTNPSGTPSVPSKSQCQTITVRNIQNSRFLSLNCFSVVFMES